MKLEGISFNALAALSAILLSIIFSAIGLAWRQPISVTGALILGVVSGIGLLWILVKILDRVVG